MKHRLLDHLPTQAVSHNPAIGKRVLLARGELPHITQFAQACFAPGQVAGEHRHLDMVEVFFVAAGQGTITIEGKAYALEPGTCIAVEPGEAHEVANTGDDELVLLYFGVETEPVEKQT